MFFYFIFRFYSHSTFIHLIFDLLKIFLLLVCVHHHWLSANSNRNLIWCFLFAVIFIFGLDVAVLNWALIIFFYFFFLLLLVFSFGAIHMNHIFFFGFKQFELKWSRRTKLALIIIYFYLFFFLFSVRGYPPALRSFHLFLLVLIFMFIGRTLFMLFAVVFFYRKSHWRSMFILLFINFKQVQKEWRSASAAAKSQKKT